MGRRSLEVPDNQLESLLNYGQEAEYKASEIILKQGAQSDALSLILAGEVAAFSYTRGREQVHLRTIGSGGHFGEIGVIEAGHRSASVVARTDCRLLRISAAQFEEICADPKLSAPVLRGLARSLAIRLADVTARFTELWTESKKWTI